MKHFYVGTEGLIPNDAETFAAQLDKTEARFVFGSCFVDKKTVETLAASGKFPNGVAGTPNDGHKVIDRVGMDIVGKPGGPVTFYFRSKDPWDLAEFKIK